jgi:hypothetical protein
VRVEVSIYMTALPSLGQSAGSAAAAGRRIAAGMPAEARMQVHERHPTKDFLTRSG